MLKKISVTRTKGHLGRGIVAAIGEGRTRRGAVGALGRRGGGDGHERGETARRARGRSRKRRRPSLRGAVDLPRPNGTWTSRLPRVVSPAGPSGAGRRARRGGARRR